MSSHDVLDLIWLVPALPLFGALFLLLFGKRIGDGVGLAKLSFDLDEEGNHRGRLRANIDPQ